MRTRRASAAKSRGEREGLLLLLSIAVFPSCAASPGRGTGPSASEPSQGLEGATEFPENAATLPRYHSKRLEVSLPLPRGSEWRIDDHSFPALVATHAATRSRALVAILRADAIVGRSECETMAEERKLVPPGPFEVLDDEVAVTQRSFDTHIEVVLLPGDNPNRPLVGHVIAFGAFLRKCYVFDFSTEVPNAGGEATLSARLAFARARILGGLVLDSMDPSVRSLPAGPDLTRVH